MKSELTPMLSSISYFWIHVTYEWKFIILEISSNWVFDKGQIFISLIKIKFCLVTLTTLSDYFPWTGKLNQSRILVPNRCYLWLKLSWVNYKIIINISESVPRNYASISITSVYKQNQFSLNMLIPPRLIIKAFPMPD